MKYSISEASRIVGVTRKTFYKHIEKKPISVEKDNNDRPVIDASELIRVYGDQCKFNLEDTEQKTAKSKQESIELSTSKASDIAVTQKELEMLKKQMDSERSSFEEQIDYLRSKLDESNSETRKLTALITDQSAKANEETAWQKSIKALETRIANQEKVVKEREEREQRILKQNKGLKKALDAEKNKNFIQKLFG